MTLKQRIALIGIVLGLVAGAVSASLLVGRQARLADVLVVFFSGFVAGASIVAAARRGSK
jgi:hypothetical protein